MAIVKYRKDIQILRGVSILLVALYHVGIPGFGNGFLGVDIFFVISGYLMAGLYNPAETRNFYLKRARRILPAYFAAILLTLLACMVLTTPNDFEQVITQSFFALTFSSNIGFWFENSYFDKAAFKPLLHLWSLGVEIQFYLLVPLLHRLIARYRVGYAALSLCSLAACIFMLGVSPKTSFFMMPLRLWEFLAGYGVALYIARNPQKENSRSRWAGAACLVILVAIPMLANIKGTALGFAHGHPGLYSVLVVISAGIFLAVGLPADVERFRVAGFLEVLGKYSYSVYLVHFPVIVLFLYQPFAGTALKPDGVLQIFELLALIGVLSIFMFRFVETPLRAYPSTLRLIFAVAFAVLIIGPSGLKVQELKFSPREMAVFGAWTDRETYRCGKIIRLAEPGTKLCQLTQIIENPKHRILLVGDSHADSVKTAFKLAAESRKAAGWFVVENNPLQVGGMSPEDVVREARVKKIDTILIHFSPGAVEPFMVDKVVRLAASEGINVSFVLPVPVWKEHIPQALYRNLKELTPLPVMTIDEYKESNSGLMDALSKIQGSNFTVHPVGQLFCLPVCKLADDSWRPLYFDNAHLTLTGGKLLQPLFGTISENGR